MCEQCQRTSEVFDGLLLSRSSGLGAILAANTIVVRVEDGWHSSLNLQDD